MTHYISFVDVSLADMKQKIDKWLADKQSNSVGDRTRINIISSNISMTPDAGCVLMTIFYSIQFWDSDIKVAGHGTWNEI